MPRSVTVMSINITPPVKPETQTKRIQLMVTPSFKERLEIAARRYDCSLNSMINQLAAAALLQLEEQEQGGGQQ